MLNDHLLDERAENLLPVFPPGRWGVPDALEITAQLNEFVERVLGENFPDIGSARAGLGHLEYTVTSLYSIHRALLRRFTVCSIAEPAEDRVEMLQPSEAFADVTHWLSAPCDAIVFDNGLYLCGASTPSGHGIGSVLRSGVVAAAAVLERNLLRQVLSGEILGDRDRLPGLRDDWDPWRECH